MDIVLDWNGRDLPAELKKLPRGRYVATAATDSPRLTAEEEAGIDKALRSIAEGRVVSLEDVKERTKTLLES